MNLEFDDLIALCDLKDVNRLRFGLESFEYSNPIFAFAYKKDTDTISVDPNTVEWIKTSRRCCDKNDGINSADYKIGKLIDKLLSSPDSYNCFEFGFIDNVTLSFTSHLSFDRSLNRVELHNSIKSLIKAQHVAFHDNPKYSKVFYKNRLPVNDKKLIEIVDYLMNYCDENRDKCRLVSDQYSVISEFPSLQELLSEYIKDTGFSFDSEEHSHESLGHLASARIIHIGWKYQDIVDESINSIVERIYGECNQENLELVLKEYSNDVLAHFILNVDFIKSFRCINV